MVAAGTGSAPFVSMVRSELRRNPNADLSQWVLLHGASYPADLGYRDELQRLVVENKLKYWGTVSRPKEAPDWKGDTGRVEAFFDGARLDDLEQRLGLPRRRLHAEERRRSTSAASPARSPARSSR